MSLSRSIRCDVAIVGGGASGYFTAANLDIKKHGCSCILFEGTSKPLAKVRISGGGRCNVTHREFDVLKLVEYYPRGFRELRGSFSRFQPKDMIAWLKQRGVGIKVESDGRIFPVSDDSSDIISCLQKACQEAGVDVLMGYRLSEVKKDVQGEGFILQFQNGSQCHCRKLVMSTGGHISGFEIASALGHTVIAPVPSLFTFIVDDPRLRDLAGISFEHVRLSFRTGKKCFEQSGPVLITHWGLSGPAILKLSAWAAPELAEIGYKGELEIDFAPHVSLSYVEERIRMLKEEYGSKQIENAPAEYFPKRYWHQLIQVHGVAGKKVAQLSKIEMASIVSEVKQARFRFAGKSTHKEEFVTAGGVKTSELDMKSMRSKKDEDLYFTGEILNIDGITGGFNFQNAWTSGYLCAMDLNQLLSTLND